MSAESPPPNKKPADIGADTGDERSGQKAAEGEVEFSAALGDDESMGQREVEGEAADTLDMDIRSIQKNSMLLDFSTKKNDSFYRRLLIILMLVVPWVLFVGVWMIFMSESTTYSAMSMREDTELWTIKNIFVSGSFVTLVTFYIALARGLFGNKVKDKSLAEKTSNAVQLFIKPSDES